MRSSHQITTFIFYSCQNKDIQSKEILNGANNKLLYPNFEMIEQLWRLERNDDLLQKLEMVETGADIIYKF